MAPNQPSILTEKEALTTRLSTNETLDSPTTSNKIDSSHPSTDTDSDSECSLEQEPVYNEDGEIQEGVGGDLQALSQQVSRNPVLSRLATNRTGISIATNGTSDPGFEIDFEENDTSDPRNWPFWYRATVIFFISYSTLTVVMYSTSYTSAIPGIKSSFGIKSDTVPVLGITTYMIGLALGSIILAPMSEMMGRRPIYLVAMAMFGLLIIPCALAQNLETILIARFFGAIAGSAMIGNSPGTVNDIVQEEHRALAFSIWSLGPMNGPVVGPLVGGFVFQYLGWRWTSWIIAISSAVAFVMICLIKETYAPAILRKKAKERRKEMDDERWWSRYDDKVAFWPLLKVNLSRPFVMAVTEPICIFWNIYIALLYSVLYLCFVAYPIVFGGERGWRSGSIGLSYIGIGVGSVIVIACEPLIRKMIDNHKIDPATGKPPPESMVSIVCIAALCVPTGELIFAWTCTPNVHWIVPILAGIPFGAGNCAVFIYSSSYLVHSYGIYAASALAGNAVLRSAMGGTLPLAGPKLYQTLGPHWAGTLLALIEFAMVPIPFIFYRYGHKIRMKSALISSMQEDKERLDAKKRKADERAVRHALRSGNWGQKDKAVEGVVSEKPVGKELEA
ncbi:MFS general substrate transporter [Tothia fuscella]|uniref:MFS general substrate transporter n=1 Tax=Tothia fuscella TaxID=1048955 RepID=A0A9P4TXC6_9PEZI|nr:MFS general substrate transporter [Tothia fuscella]